jgi:hypothetical protein
VEVALPSHSWLSLQLTRFPSDDGHATLCLNLLRAGLYVKVPCPPFMRGPCWEDPSYGLYLCGESQALVLCLGNRSKFLTFPWALEFYKRWEHVRVGREMHWIEMPRNSSHGELAAKETHPFTYTLRSGERQEVTATVWRGRMEWRQRWLPFTSLGNRTSESIDVEFSSGVGERVGTWKGGVLGTGWEARPDETNEQALRRMEREWRA